MLLIPTMVVSANPVMDEFAPTRDLPDTTAPIITYDGVNIGNYSMDIYMPPEEEEDDGNWFTNTIDAVNPVSGLQDIDKKVMEQLYVVGHMILTGIWKFYVFLVNGSLSLVESAFTFDLISQLSGHVAAFIAEVGSSNGIGQFTTAAFFFVSIWLVYVALQKQFRAGFGGLLVAAVISGVFALYVTNSDTVINAFNGARADVTNAIFDSSTYALDEGQDAITEEAMMEAMTPTYGGLSTTAEPDYADFVEQDSSLYGLSRMRNLMHDLLIVKPWLLLQFGTTDLALIGGAENGGNEATDDEIQAGKDRVISFLETPPNSEERASMIEDMEQSNIGTFSPGYNVDRIVTAFVTFVPALLIVPFVAIIAVLTQVHSVLFLIQAALGVFILLLAIIPIFRMMAKEWVKKLVTPLAKSIGYIFMLIVLFSFVNMIYRVSADNAWSHFETMSAVIIVALTMVVMSASILNYDMREARRNRKQTIADRIDRHRSEHLQERQRKRDLQLQTGEKLSYVGAGYFAGQQAAGQNSQHSPARTTQKRVQRMNQDETAPIKNQNQSERQQKNPDKSSGNGNNRAQNKSINRKNKEAQKQGLIKKKQKQENANNTEEQTGKDKRQGKESSKNKTPDQINRMNRRKDNKRIERTPSQQQNVPEGKQTGKQAQINKMNRKKEEGRIKRDPSKQEKKKTEGENKKNVVPFRRQQFSDNPGGVIDKQPNPPEENRNDKNIENIKKKDRKG